MLQGFFSKFITENLSISSRVYIPRCLPKISTNKEGTQGKKPKNDKEGSSENDT